MMFGPWGNDDRADATRIIHRALDAGINFIDTADVYSGSDVDLPFGAGEVSLHIPDQVRAEFEVEVDGTEVEVELEFKWSTARPDAETRNDPKEASKDHPRKPGGTRRSAKAQRPAQRPAQR